MSNATVAVGVKKGKNSFSMQVRQLGKTSAYTLRSKPFLNNPSAQSGKIDWAVSSITLVTWDQTSRVDKASSNGLIDFIYEKQEDAEYELCYQPQS